MKLSNLIPVALIACSACTTATIEIQSPADATTKMCSNEFNRQNGADGCWVELFTETDLGGHCVRVYGPIEFADMDNDVFEELDGDIESIRVGPRARVELFEDAEFQGDRQSLSARSLVSELDALVIDDDAESLKILLDS